MENLRGVEEEMFKFLRNSFGLSPKQLPVAFQKLLDIVKKYERNRFETRAFAYLDIISWLESKIKKVPVQNIIHERYLERQKTKKHAWKKHFLLCIKSPGDENFFPIIRKHIVAGSFCKSIISYKPVKWNTRAF